MKFGFVTCVQIGLSCIEKIYEIGGKLEVLITLHDHKAKKKSGRIYLNDFSSKHQVPLLKINHVNDAAVVEAIKNYDLDWLFIIGWSQIASKEVLDAPKQGCIGIHPTLLPVGRGRAAIPWAILKGLEKTGVSMFILNEGVDTGPLLGQYEIPIDKEETAETLYGKVNLAHELLIAEIYPQLQNGTFEALPQDDAQATYWEGRKPSDGELSLNMKVSEADRLIRATTRPYPGAYLVMEDKKRIIWQGRIVDLMTESENNTYIRFSDGIYEILRFEDQDKC